LAQAGFNAYAAVGVLLLMALTFGVGNLIVTHVLGPTRQGEVKGGVYESGMDPIGSARRRFNVRFYLVAMAFLLFDVEIIFLYPWATTFPSLGGSVAEAEQLNLQFIARMLFFVLTSVIAFVYAWKKGVFRYD
jgi:NADH-quinone oxidoreductase subunit A